MWETIYQAPTNQYWVGRHDAPANTCVFQVIKPCDIRNVMPKRETELTFALLGFACDAGVKRNSGRIGAKEGPDMIRRALAAAPIKRSAVTLYDVGNLICVDDQLEAAQTALSEVVALLLARGITPIVLGGGHELAWGHYQGIANAFCDRSLGIVNFDAHLDMRPLLPSNQGSSGTPFLQIANDCNNKKRAFDYTCIGLQPMGNSALLEDTAATHHVKAIYADQLHEQGLEASRQLLHDVINRCQSLYVSICLDVFAAPFAPGVSAPQVLGLMPWQVIALLRALAQSKKVVSYDLAEFCPAFDIDSRTAKLAANLIYEIIHHHTV